jgi:hypothetical protein
MGWNKLIMMKKSTACFFMALVVVSMIGACSVSYKFEGGSINYDKTQTIHISEFPNRTANYPLLSQVFNLALRKRFIEQTRLKEVNNNADIEIEGEITNYQLTPQAVRESDYASKTRLTISIRVHYINNKEANKDLDQTFSAFQDFDSNQPLDAVEGTLVQQIVDEIVDMIYNATVANW